MKVSLFITCLTDVFSSDVGKDTVDLLERLGCEIDFPEGQTCCGQPAYNSGYVKKSMETMKHMITTFEHAEYVVAPSGSCVTMLKEYPTLFKNDPLWEPKATELAEKSYELTEFIVNVLGVVDVGAELEAVATYHSSCHMSRLLGVKEPPKKLLEQVRGLELKPLPHCEDCCGFGGTFSVKMSDISEQMVNEKVMHIDNTGAELLVGADGGCLMNIGGRIDRLGKPIKIKHIASVLNQTKKR